MTEGLGYHVGRFFRGLTPGLVSLSMAILALVPMTIPQYGWVAPNLALIPVYFWAIHQPGYHPASVAFGVGVFFDLIAHTPLGLNALVLVAVYWLALSQRRLFMGQPFVVMWSGFILVAVGASGLSWLVASLYAMTAMPAGPLVVQALLVSALFVPVSWCLSHLHYALLPAEG